MTRGRGPSGFGPKDRCQRTVCVNEHPPHLAGRHLDQRDELYDGPDTLLQVLPLAVRDSARKLVREAPALMPEVVDLGRHIEWLRDQVAHVRVDADRRERRALASAASCEQHGKDITYLGEQAASFEADARRNDAGRVALLGLLHQIEEFTREWRQGNRDHVTVADVVSALEKAAKQTSAAHMRAWKNPPKQPRPRPDGVVSGWAGALTGGEQ